MQTYQRRRGRHAPSSAITLLFWLGACSMDAADAASLASYGSQLRKQSHPVAVDEVPIRRQPIIYNGNLLFLSRFLKKEKEKEVKKDEEEPLDDDCWGWTKDWGNGKEYEKCQEDGGFEYELDPDRPPERCHDYHEGMTDEWGWFDVCEEWERLYGERAVHPSDVPSSVPSASATTVSVPPSSAPSQILTKNSDSTTEIDPLPMASSTLSPVPPGAQLDTEFNDPEVDHLSDPTTKPVELPQLTSIPLPIFNMDLVFLTIRRQQEVTRMMQRQVLLDINESDLALLTEIYLTEVFSELHADFTEVQLILTIRDELVSKRNITVRSVFTGNVIFSGSRFGALPDHEELASATLESFRGRTFTEKIQTKAKNPVLASVQSVIVQNDSSETDVEPQQAVDIDGEGSSNAGIITGVVVGFISVVLVSTFLAFRWHGKKRSCSSTLSHDSSLGMGSVTKGTVIKKSFFLKPRSIRASAGAKEILDSSSLHGSSPDKKTYERFEDGEREDECGSFFSGLKYGSSAMGEGMDPVLEKEGEGMIATVHSGHRSDQNDGDTLMNMSELGRGERLGQVLQLECAEGMPHTKQMDFNDIWKNDESLEDVALSVAVPESALDIPNVQVEQHGKFTMELIKDLPRDFRPEDSQSDLTDLSDAKMAIGDIGDTNLLSSASGSLSNCSESDSVFDRNGLWL